MSTNDDNNCDHCGKPLNAQRSTKIYCSNSCRTMAYRKRKADYEQSLYILEQKKLIEIKYEKWLAEINERNRLEIIAKNERLRIAEIERQEKKDKENALKRRQLEQKMVEIKKKNSQNEVIAMALGGIANRIIENLSKNYNAKESQDNSNDINKK